MATAYACFVFVYAHIHKTVPDPTREHILAKLCYRWNRICSPVHGLAFFCDPFYHDFRERVTADIGIAAIKLGGSDLRQQCRAAIALLARDEPEGALQLLLDEYLRYCVNEDGFRRDVGSITKYSPRQIWSQASDEYPALARLLVKVYSGPASTAGVERNHKVGKRVHTSARNRCGDGKVERQIAVVHNGNTSKTNIDRFRHKFDVYLAAYDFEAAPPLDDEADTGEDESAVDHMQNLLSAAELLEADSLGVSVYFATSAEEISDEILFASNEPELAEERAQENRATL